MVVDVGGSYTLSNKIRETAYAVLLRGVRNEDRTPVVLKIPRADNASRVHVAKLKHEYALLESLKVPGVVRALGLEKLQGGQVALVLEDVGERSLDTLLAGRRLDLRKFLRTAISIADVVASVHRNQIIHKDIKPHHFFEDAATGEIKLIDFGIATRLSHEAPSARSVSQLQGTLAYMSPEQTGRMNRSLDRRTDLYSLGVTLYELLTGSLPFQGTDPLELVHSHIARTPVTPHKIAPEIPPVLSDIVMKLMSKVAEDRYQDAGGLKADLQRCLAALDATGTVAAFPLGQRDFSDELRIPQKLYGREAESVRLLATFERTRQGAVSLMLISGHSGIGKSALISEIHRQLVRGGAFVAGKFDQIGRSVPYAPIAAACRDLVRSILTEAPEALAGWRQKILHAVGPNGQVLVDLIPELVHVIGPQPPLPELGPSELQHRFELVFQAFLSLFASAEHPLAFFLDDLQWADPASLRLVQLLLTSPRSSHLLVIGAYRDNEVDPLHPLTLFLAELAKTSATVNTIPLGELGLDEVARLLGETFGCAREEVILLAELLLRKTHGNPFFLNQFLTALHKDKLLVFDSRSCRWTWELERVERAAVTDNVVEFMLAKLQGLGPASQRLLELAACVGYRFDRNTLSVVAERSPAELTADLWPALREGLLVPLDDGEEYLHDHAATEGEIFDAQYRFLHDRVQQAAYALIDDADKQAVHLRIGRLMMAKEAGAESRLFDVVNHMNIGAALITDREERLALARLNLKAGRRARDAAAHATAARLLGACLSLLGDSAWESSYDIAYPAHLTKAECEFVCNNVDEAQRLIDVVERQARSPLERAAARDLRTLILTNLNRMEEAIAYGVGTARLLGMEFPETDPEYGPAIGAELTAVGAALAGRSIESLIDLPTMTDPESRALLSALYQIIPAATQLRPHVMVLAVAKAVNLALRRGNGPVSSYFYVCYGLVLAVSGDYDTAYRLGQLSIQLNERVRHQAVSGANHFVFAAFVSAWRKHLSESLELLRVGLKVSLDTGDYLHAAYCVSHQANHRLFSGESLDELAADLPGFKELLERTGDVVNLKEIAVLGQLVADLRGQTTRRGSLEGGSAGFDPTAFEREVTASGNRFLISSFHLFRGIAGCVAADYPGAWSDLQKGVAAAVPGNFVHAEATFYHALAAAGRLRTEPGLEGGERATLLDLLKADQETLAKWLASSPSNFAHRHALVSAELASLTDEERAQGLYDEAIALARQNGSLACEAMANELAGRFLTVRDRTKIGRVYLADAADAYRRWGATSKVRELAPAQPAPITSGGLNTVSVDVATFQLDAMSVVRASQAISTEIVLRRLVQSLMRIVIEQAGAQNGHLLLVRNGRLWVEASAGSEQQSPSARFELDLSSDVENPRLPQSVVGYVQRTKERVLLTQAEAGHRFSGDRYFASHTARSLLCLPMMRQGQLIGILYLENSLTSGAFTADRVAILEALAAQAAISLENAALYEEMEQRVEDRTRELQASLRLIRENQAQLVEAERKMAVAHYASEMAIARQIQTSILPRRLKVAGLEVAARMATASEVGGDYYDLQQTPDGGCWIGVGDVSGHGLNAGLIMLMIQSGLSCLMRRDPMAEPVGLLSLLNRMLYDNIRERLERDDFATLSLLRFYPDGRFVVAGAHEDVIVWRQASGTCEIIPTTGVWMGITENAGSKLHNGEHQLRRGDVLLLYTDGLTEARSPEGELFGLQRLVQAIQDLHGEPMADVCDRIFERVQAWSTQQEDDRSLVVLRYQG
jgi:predicted ATPase/serine phosphatase RsbU (regulator of sigma subunit)/tRNA A-37 threonylcarbamoyl transferase component Bud32